MKARKFQGLRRTLPNTRPPEAEHALQAREAQAYHTAVARGDWRAAVAHAKAVNLSAVRDSNAGKAATWKRLYEDASQRVRPTFPNGRRPTRVPEGQTSLVFGAPVAPVIQREIELSTPGYPFVVHPDEDSLHWYGTPALAWVSIAPRKGFWEPAVVHQVYNGGALVEVHIPSYHRDARDTVRLPAEEVRRATGQERSMLAQRAEVEKAWTDAGRAFRALLANAPDDVQDRFLRTEGTDVSMHAQQALRDFDFAFARGPREPASFGDPVYRFLRSNADHAQVFVRRMETEVAAAVASSGVGPSPSKREVVRALLRRGERRVREEEKKPRFDLRAALRREMLGDPIALGPGRVLQNLLDNEHRAGSGVPVERSFADDPAAQVALLDELGLHGEPFANVRTWASSRAMDPGVEPWMERSSVWYSTAEDRVRADDTPAVRALNKADQGRDAARIARAAAKVQALEATRPARIAALARELYQMDAERGITGTDRRYLVLPNPSRPRRRVRRRR